MASFDHHWIIFALLVVSAWLKQVHPVCSPVEEGKGTVIDCEVDVGDSCPENIGRIITWRIDDGTSFFTAGTCSETNCDVDSSAVSSITIAGSRPVFYSNLSITSVTRSNNINEETEWQCATKPECGDHTVIACPGLEIYALPENPTCSLERVFDQGGNLTGFRVISNTSKVYPEAKCRFYHNRDSVLQSNFVEGMDTSVNQVSDDPVYYSYEWETNYALDQLGVGNHTFYSRMYPNVTDGQDLTGVVDTPCGEDELSLPTTTSNCTQTDGYFEGRSVSCTCDVDSQGYPEGEAKWYENGQEMMTDENSSLTINYNESDTTTRYTCIGTSSLGEGEGPSFFPSFAFLDDNSVEVKVQKSESDDPCTQNINNISVVCSVPKESANPNVTFIFFLNEENGNTVDSTQPLQAELNESHFQLQHTFSQVQGGEYQVLCRAANTIFPNLIVESSSDSSTVYGPPSNEPIVKIENKIYEDGQSINVNNDFSGAVTCEVNGGSPPAENITIHCISNNSNVNVTSMDRLSFENSPLTHDMMWVKCNCKADHASGCYDKVTSVTIIIDAPPPSPSSSSSSSSKIYTYVGIGVGVGAVCLVIVIIIVYKKKKKVRKTIVRIHKKCRITTSPNQPTAEDEPKRTM